MLLVLVHVLVTLMVVLLEVAHYTPGKKKRFNFQSTQASNYEALKSLRGSHSTYVVMVSCGF